MGLQADMRAASVTLLEDYATSASVKLQVYPARPRSLNPPTAFVDTLGGTTDHTTALTKFSPVAEMVLVHGLFDSKEAADQRDAFMDGFLDWVEARYHAAGANRMVALTEWRDLPAYVPEWLPPAEQKTYYATVLSLEGFQG